MHDDPFQTELTPTEPKEANIENADHVAAVNDEVPEKEQVNNEVTKKDQVENNDEDYENEDNQVQLTNGDADANINGNNVGEHDDEIPAPRDSESEELQEVSSDDKETDDDIRESQPRAALASIDDEE